MKPCGAGKRIVCEDAKRIAVLENVMNPTNVGAIFRSAAALHMDAVLLTPACSQCGCFLEAWEKMKKYYESQQKYDKIKVSHKQSEGGNLWQHLKTRW